MDIYIDDKLNISILFDVPANILKKYPNNERKQVKNTYSKLFKPFNMFDYVKEAFNLNISENYTVEQDQNNKIKTPFLQLQTTAFSNNESEFKFLKEMQYCGIPYDDANNNLAGGPNSNWVQEIRKTELNELIKKEFWVYSSCENKQNGHIFSHQPAFLLFYSYIQEKTKGYNKDNACPAISSSSLPLAHSAFEKNREYNRSDYFKDLGINNIPEFIDIIGNDTEFNCFYILLSNNKLRKILFLSTNTDEAFKKLNDYSWEAYKKNLSFKIPDTNREIEWAQVNKFISDCRFSRLKKKAYTIKCDYKETSKFTYFCVLYLKVRDRLDFVKCEGCGKQKPIKPSSYDRKNDYYCENCKNNPEFSKIKYELNRDREKYDKAIKVFKDKVKEDDPEVYKEDDVKTSFYNELIEKIRKKTNNYLVKKRKITVGNVKPDDNTDYDEKYNDLTKIYEKYFTPVNFFKIITADLKKVTKKEINSWEITIFDEAIKRLRESHNIDLTEIENYDLIYDEYEENWKNQKKVPVEKFFYDPKKHPIQEQEKQPSN